MLSSPADVGRITGAHLFAQNTRSFSHATKGTVRDLLLSGPTELPQCQCRAISTKIRVAAPDLRYRRCVLITYL